MMRTRTRYIPIEAADEGLVLGEAVQDRYRTTLLPSGATLSDENLQQMVAHQIEFVCVVQADARTDEVVADEAAAAAKNVLEIFESADLSDPVMAALFNQVLMYRSE